MTFQVIPSIDLIEGQVVRIERGDFARKTVYSDDPVATAKRWQDAGGARLHVVDLDATIAGEPRHRETVEAIVRALSIPVQVAGGIRTLDLIDAWLQAGADRVVLGTQALTDEAFLREAIARFGDALVIAPDARNREVYVSGWREGTGEDVVDAAKRLAAAGVARLLVTDVGMDGMLAGPNIELLSEVAAAAGIPVQASGGVSSVDDLRALATVPGIEGAIIGRALYTGDVDVSEAVRAVA